MGEEELDVRLGGGIDATPPPSKGEFKPEACGESLGSNDAWSLPLDLRFCGREREELRCPLRESPPPIEGNQSPELCYSRRFDAWTSGLDLKLIEMAGLRRGVSPPLFRRQVKTEGPNVASLGHLMCR